MPRKVNYKSVKRRSKSSSKKYGKKRNRSRTFTRSRRSASKKIFCKPKGKKVKHNLVKYVKKVRKETKSCKVMTPRGNIIDLPSEYPGDDFVFSELYTNPADKYNAELVESSILKDVYNKYHRMCF